MSCGLMQNDSDDSPSYYAAVGLFVSTDAAATVR